MVWNYNGETARNEMSCAGPSPENPGALSKMDLEILGRKECRLCVPIVSRYDLRMVADIMRGLATVLDFESRRQDVPERATLFRIQQEIGLANRRIQDHFREVFDKLGLLPPSRGGRPRNDG